MSCHAYMPLQTLFTTGIDGGNVRQVTIVYVGWMHSMGATIRVWHYAHKSADDKTATGTEVLITRGGARKLRQTAVMRERPCLALVARITI